MSLTVKAYLTRAGGSQEKEIRRFTVDHDVSTNFVYLTKKVVFVFPALEDKTFHLRWKDSENDLVLFSSDEELTQALGFVDDGVFKIYIEEVPETGRHSSEQKSRNCEDAQDVPHPGVKCDGCEGPIFGTRFKCQTCPNFDLCSGCRGTGFHAEHAFDDINTPVNSFNMFGEHFRRFAAAMPQVWFQGGMMPPMFQHWAQQGNENQGSGAPPHGGCRGMRKAWRKWCREMYGKKYGKRHGGCTRAEGEHGGTSAGGEKQSEKMDAEASGVSTSAEKDTTKEAGSTNKERKNADVESGSSDEEEAGGERSYLEEIGKTVADFLTPFGIDVEAFVTNKGTGSEPHAKTSEQEGGPGCGPSGQCAPHCGPGGPSRPHCGPFGPQCGPFGPHGGPCLPKGGPFAPGGGPFGPHGGSFGLNDGSAGSHSHPFGPGGFPYRPRGQSFGCHGRPLGPQNGSFGPRGGPFGPDRRPCGPEGSSFGPQGGNYGPQGGSWGYPGGFNSGQFGPHARPWGPFNYGPQTSTSGRNENTSTSGTFGSQGEADHPGDQGQNTNNDHSGMDHSQTVDSSETLKEGENTTSSATNDRPQNSGDRLIADAIETMKGMGFSDDGGWLSALLTAHKGDVGSALDAIHANRPQ